MGASVISSKVITEHIVKVDKAIAETNKLAASQKALGGAVVQSQTVAATAAAKTGNTFVEQTSRMKKGIGFVTSSIGAVTGALGVATLAVGALDAVFDAFSSKSRRHAQLLSGEMRRMGVDMDSVTDVMLNMGRAADAVNARLAATASLWATLAGAKAKIAGDKQQSDIEAMYGDFTEGGYRFLAAERTRQIEGFTLTPGASKAEREAGEAQIKRWEAERDYAIARTKVLEEARQRETKAFEERMLAGADADKRRAADLAKDNRLETSTDQWSPFLGDSLAAQGGDRIRSIAPRFGGMRDQFGWDTATMLERLNITQGQLAAEQGPGLIERVFGSPDKIDLVAESLGSLKNAAESAFSAWTDGSMTAGAAMKKMFRDILADEAKLMFGKAITHGAMAIGEWAWGSNVKAAKHGAAAAKFAAGAIAVGAIARQFGAGSGGGSGGGTGGVGGDAAYGGRRAPDTGGGTTNIYVGDDWARKPPREREELADDILRTATRRGSSVIVSRS